MKHDEGGVQFTGLVDLGSQALGGRAIACSDEFFAEMGNLLKPGRGAWLPDEYTERGKWMDGWESRRRRGGPDSDFCVVALGAPGRVRALDIDTNHFLGNHPPFAAVDGVHAPDDAAALASESWNALLPQVPLRPGSQNLFVVTASEVVTHVRLRIFPDGGVARLRVWGDVSPTWALRESDPAVLAQVGPHECDLVSLANGGAALACSDMFFSPMQNLILPGPAKNMGGGWETRRKRTSGHDWILLKLGARGRPRFAVFDTAFFKGNYPDRAWLEAIDAGPARTTDLLASDAGFRRLTPEIKLGPDSRVLVAELDAPGPISHVRVHIAPDGGLSRFRLYGTREPGP